MKRSRRATPQLKHLAFFEKLSEDAEETPAYRGAMAGLLALRLIDHWILAGAVMVEPESTSVRSLRQAIMAIPANDPQRELLLGVVNTMQTLREVDVQPVLPRMFAYAGMLEKRGMLELAADAYESVIGYSDGEYDGDVVIDSYMRLGYCRRQLGSLPESEIAYEEAGRIAKSRKEHDRVLHARIGVAKVAMERGNLPDADQMLGEIAEECALRKFERIRAMALHDRATVAIKREDYSRAVCLAYESLELTSGAGERERVLNDIAAAFVALGRFTAARTALLISEATAIAAESRLIARLNLMSLAARAGDQQLFTSYRSALESVVLPPELRANYLIESVRGLRRFDEDTDADGLLEEAQAIARAHGLNRTLFEIDGMLSRKKEPVGAQSSGGPAEEPDPTARVAVGLELMLAAIES